MSRSHDFLHDLPVAAVLDAVMAASRSGAVVVTAPPGSGKTMLVPAAICDDLSAGQRLILMQPRRLAARAVAQQIARLRGGEVGGWAGYQVRFDTRVGRDTRLIVETTGIMLRRLSESIGLEGIGAVVLDEFHERTLEMDLVLGLLVRVRQTIRPDLRIIVMSATLQAEPVAQLLAEGRPGGCPVVSTQGRLFPVTVHHQKRGDQRDAVEIAAATVPEALSATDGHVLVFLPGVGEILQCQQALGSLADRQGHALLTLYGDLPAEAQDRVLGDLGRRKIILSTNVAETSLTIPGVTAVIDSGLARSMRMAPATGLPRLELGPISRASADQRAGRAGRTGPGHCWRLWDEASHHHRPAADVPEVLRGDLAGSLLQLLALGETADFPWLDAPPAEALQHARRLLFMLGAIDAEDRVEPLGRELVRLPAHPRLGRLLLAGVERGVLREAALAAALLSERDPFRSASPGGGPRDRMLVRTRSDVIDRVAALQAFQTGRSLATTHSGNADLHLHPAGAQAVLRAAEQFSKLLGDLRGPAATDPDTALMQALLTAFPDRLARLRPGATDRATMVGGRGVRLDGGSRVRQEPLFLAIDLNDDSGEARVRLASAVDRAWLEAMPANLRRSEELFFNPSRRQVDARLRTEWVDLMLDETPVPIRDLPAAAQILAQAARLQLDRVLPKADSPADRFLKRMRWLAAALPDLNLPLLDEAALADMLAEICLGNRSLDEVAAADWLSRLHAAVGYQRLPELEQMAPAELTLPTGKRHKLQYEPGSPPVLAVRIQELFGVRDTPRVAGGRLPVLLHLLGPNHRPQQVTADLAGFWERTYPEVRKELRRRYPRHSWPDDPLTSPAPGPARKRDTT